MRQRISYPHQTYRITMVPILIGIVLLLTTTIAWAATSTVQSEQDVAKTISSRINGIVWTDLNRNGLLDEQEPPVANETIFLTPDVESDFAQILVLSTDQDGQFNAGNLTSGRYRIWTASQSDRDALVINVTDDRAITVVQLPLAGHTLYLPFIGG